MFCKQCGTQFPDDVNFCPSCGAAAAPAAPVEQPAPVVNSAPQATAADESRAFFARYPEYRPLNPWAYFGLSVLYALPIIGFIFLIVHSCNSSNLNRRSYARSFWCALIIAVCITVVVLLISLIAGVSIWEYVENIGY